MKRLQTIYGELSTYSGTSQRTLNEELTRDFLTGRSSTDEIQLPNLRDLYTPDPGPSI